MESLFKIPMFEPEPGLMIWTVISFVILFLVLAKVGYKPILGIIKKREEDIRNSIDEAEHVRGDAEKLFEDYKKQLAQARKEAQETIEQGKQVGESVKAEIMAEANTEAQQMLKKAQAEIAREKEKAIAELQAQVADLTIMATSKVIQKSLDEAGQRRLVEEAVAEVSRVGKA